MIGNLKKLEASDSGAIATDPFSKPQASPYEIVREDRRLLNIPQSGWLSGGGRPVRTK